MSNQIFPDILSIPSKPQDLFELIECLSSNHFTKVYKAIHKISNRSVAIKIINTSYTSQYNTIQSEISLLKACTECNFIIKYYGSYFSISTNELWIIYEYCDCSTVNLINATDRTFTENEIATIVEMLLKALVFLHSNHLYHNEIKGDNVMLNEEGYAKFRHICKKNKKGNCGNKTKEEEVERLREKDIIALGRMCIELSEGEVMDKDKDDIDEEYHSKDFNDFVKKCIKGNMNITMTAIELLKHSFIKHYAKPKEYIANLVKYHHDTIKEYRKLMQEKEKEKLEENNKSKQLLSVNTASHKNILSNSIDINNNNNSSGNSLIINSLNSNKEEDNNNKELPKAMNNSFYSKASNAKNNESTPEFMKYINNNNFIFDEKHYYESNKKNNNKEQQFSIDLFPPPLRNIDEYQKTLSHHSTKSINNTRYSILMKYRNDHNLIRKISGNPTTVTENSSPKKAFLSKDYNKLIHHSSTLSIIDLIEDKDINDLPLVSLKKKLADMTLEKKYELEYINAKHNALIDKYTYAINILLQFPNVKTIKEYIDLYNPHYHNYNNDNINKVNENRNGDDIMTHDKIISASMVIDDQDTLINPIRHILINTTKRKLNQTNNNHT